MAPTRSNYLRLVQVRPGSYEVQTAAVTMALRDRQGGEFRVDLVSTVHVAQPAYYDSLASQCTTYDRVLFELLVDESMVRSEDDGASGRTVRRLAAPLRASPALQLLAERNGLTTQVEALDCCQPNFVLADVSRRQLAVQEARLQGAEGKARLPPQAAAAFDSARRVLVGPLSRGMRPSPLRLLLALLPAPEVSFLLDDWLSSGGASPSPALQPLAAALSRGDLRAARQLSFAQTLCAGEKTQDGSLSGSLVRWRNARAIDEVDQALAAGCGRLALVYGALHMRDLRARLQQRYDLLSISEPEWSTAWTIHVPDGDGSASLAVLAASAIGLLLVDGADWIEATQAFVRGFAAAVAPSLDAAPVPFPELVAAAALYTLRHGVLYLALSRWAFEWDSRWWAVEGDGRA